MTTPKEDKCAGCGKKGARVEMRAGLGRVVVLDENGMCADCAPPAMRCPLGVPCEFGRVVMWRHEDRAALKKLRMCDVHTKARNTQLRAAKKRDDALQKAADKARAARERGEV